MSELTAAERETYFNYSDESDICTIYTCSKPLQNKLNKLCSKYPDTYKLVREDKNSKTYTTNKKYISIRQPKTLSEEYIAKLQDNAKKMRENNK